MNRLSMRCGAGCAYTSSCVTTTIVALTAVRQQPRASDPGSGDWPMWGGTPDRNMVSSMKGLPTTWDVKTKKNVKWVAELGSQGYGNPVVAGGVVLVGTNNEAVRDPNVKGDKGILMAFRESDGQFLWQPPRQARRAAAPTTGRTRASARRRSSRTARPTTCRTAAS